MTGEQQIAVVPAWNLVAALHFRSTTSW